MRRIVVLGGGVAGLSAARKLSDELSARSRFEISLVASQAYFVNPNAYADIAADNVAMTDASVPIRKILESPVQVEIDYVNQIDLSNKIMKGELRDYPFDYAVIATGAVAVRPEKAVRPLFLNSSEDAMAVRERLLSRVRHARSAERQKTRESDLTFVIVGAGSNGVELAASLANSMKRISTHARAEFGASVRIVLIEEQERILPRMPEAMSETVHHLLIDQGIEVRLNERAMSADEHQLQLTGGRTIDTQNVIWCIGKAINPLFENFDTDTDGRPRVNRYLEHVGSAGVYIAGDAAGVGEQIAWNAKVSVSQGRLAAKNLVAQIGGRSRKGWSAPSDFHSVSLGSNAVVASPDGSILTGVAARSRVSMENSQILPFAFGKRRWLSEIVQNSLKVFDRTERSLLTDD